MSIPPHLLDAARRHRAAGKRVGLVLRHAERHHVHDLATHEEVLLTENGHAQARTAGALLAEIADRIRVLHSPVERCRETARGLVDGAGEHNESCDIRVSRAVAELYAPFVLDREQAWRVVMGTGPKWIRQWFDGKLPTGIFEPRASAAQAQLDVYAAYLDDAAAADRDLTVFVSHDWNIALVREDVLAFSPEHGWPGFLDGFVVVLDGDDLIVELDGRVGRRPRRGAKKQRDA